MSEKINNIDFEKCALDISNDLYCIIDKYHFYEYEKLKRFIEMNYDIVFHKEEMPNDVEIFKRIIELIKDKNKYLTIGIFHC